MFSDRLALLQDGIVIPASPLTLDNDRKWDQQGQKLLYRYYSDCGVGGIAVAVHSTQFAIRDKQHGLFEPLLRLASYELKRLESARKSTILRIAGVCGKTAQATTEAELAASLDYDAVLLSLGAMKEESNKELIDHCKTVANILPLIGFYLQPDVGGRVLPYEFWREFAEIKNVVAIKLAPFNRYRTIDAIRGVADSSRAAEIALYTGNDDNIIVDLLTEFNFGKASLCFKGGLLGQWCVWTKAAVDLLNEIKSYRNEPMIPKELLIRAAQLTDANAVVFDAHNGFKGCIPGIHEVLRRQGLMKNNYCLDPAEVLSDGQIAGLDRIEKDYPWILDNDFVNEHIAEWKRDS